MEMMDPKNIRIIQDAVMRSVFKKSEFVELYSEVLVTKKQPCEDGLSEEEREEARYPCITFDFYRKDNDHYLYTMIFYGDPISPFEKLVGPKDFEGSFPIMNLITTMRENDFVTDDGHSVDRDINAHFYVDAGNPNFHALMDNLPENQTKRIDMIEKCSLECDQFELKWLFPFSDPVPFGNSMNFYFVCADNFSWYVPEGSLWYIVSSLYPPYIYIKNEAP